MNSEVDQAIGQMSRQNGQKSEALPSRIFFFLDSLPSLLLVRWEAVHYLLATFLRI